MSEDLAGFLLARIAEDEQRLDNALWYTRPDGTRLRPRIEGEDVEVAKGRVFRRELAECEAKRRIVEEHRPIRCENQRHDRGDGLHCVVCSYDDIPREWHPCPTLRLIALPYADHPDYREEWRP